MKEIKEPSRTVPVMAETDVLVVGSGPGGLAAALAAAREGVDTILVERYGCFGGNITQSQVETISWYRHEKTVEAGGIGVEFERRAKEMGGSRKNRESLGEYNITEQDVKNEARFEDSIGIFPEFLDAYGVVIIPTTGRYFQVPYGITVPRKVENLLVAGRCVAGDRMSHAATRQMMCCAVTGQGAGVAAAVSVKDNVTCRRVDIRTVQKALEKQGVRIA